MNDLFGIRLPHINNESKGKFVLKVGKLQNNWETFKKGDIIGYRYANSQDAISYKLNMIGIDCAAVDLAIREGMKYLLLYLKDKGITYAIKTREIGINDKCFTLDMGERTQYRFKNVYKSTTWSELWLGYVPENRIITLKEN